MVQWLRPSPSNAEGTGSIPNWGTKIPHAVWLSQKVKKLNKKECGMTREGSMETHTLPYVK